VDRVYKSGIKTYTQSPKTSDIVIGLKPLDNRTFDMYFVPTILIKIWGTKSRALSKIELLKNNYLILENCKNEKLIQKTCNDYGIL
jgi:hypothetical protein